jgi:DNA polymerase
MAAAHKATCLEEAGRLTGLENPNSVKQLKKWLSLPDDVTLNKEAVKGLLEHSDNATVTRVLELRQMMAKSSVSKYEAMRDMACKDGRIRGSILYYGASTGRFSGRGLQPHNLPRVSIGEDYEPLARQMVKDNDPLTELTFGSIPHLLSALLRTAIIPPAGTKFRVDDYSQIEARVCAWLADEKWILDVFNTRKPYYEATAAMLYKVPIESVSKELRQKGKAAALALQYQGGVGALERVGGIKGSEEEKQDIVNRWRAACPNIKKLWYRLLEASIQTVREKKGGRVGKVSMRFDRGCLFIGLPSGRDLIYRDAVIGVGKFGGEVVKHLDSNGVLQELSPGILTENITQAIARDCLTWELVKPEVRSTCVLHVHDEEVLEGPQVIFTQPSWAPGLPIEGAGFDCVFYRKG